MSRRSNNHQPAYMASTEEKSSLQSSTFNERVSLADHFVIPPKIRPKDPQHQTRYDRTKELSSLQSHCADTINDREENPSAAAGPLLMSELHSRAFNTAEAWRATTAACVTDHKTTLDAASSP